jgi:hypothetical protein
MSLLMTCALLPFHVVREIASHQPLTNITLVVAYADMVPNVLLGHYVPDVIKPIIHLRTNIHRKCWRQVIWYAEFADCAIELLAAEQIEPRT